MAQAVTAKNNPLGLKLNELAISELAIPIAIVAIVVALIMPMPGFLLDFLIVVDIMLSINAQTYSIEAANVRHEHEVELWKTTKLPDGKMLAPGVVTHSTPLIEHPQLVANRIQRFAEAVGRENVIASTDCGLGLRLHPSLAWAKLNVLTEGARLASEALWWAAAVMSSRESSKRRQSRIYRAP